MESFTTAAVVVGVSLAAISQVLGILTVRARLSGLKLSTAEDQAYIAERAERQQPLDLRIFLFAFRHLLLIPCTPTVSHDYCERLVKMHRHATENNASAALLIFSNWIALSRCETRGQDCSSSAEFSTAAAYAYLCFRVVHLIFYSLATRQPYRALAFIGSNVCLSLQIRSLVSTLS